MTAPIAPPPLDASDAMAVAVVLANAYAPLMGSDVPLALREGATLLFDAAMRMIRAQLPASEGLDPVRSLIGNAATTACAIRRRHGLPVLQ